VYAILPMERFWVQQSLFADLLESGSESETASIHLKSMQCVVPTGAIWP
jgi:hypothetical protein